MAWKLSNFAESTLQQYLASGATTIYIDADEVDLLPTLAVGDKAKGVLFNSSQREIVNVTAWTTDGTLTVERAQESTGNYNWEAGTRFIHTPTAELLEFVTNALAEIGEFSGTATYSAGNYEVTIAAAIAVPTPSDGDTIQFVIPTTNTGAATVSFTNGTDTLAAAAIKHLSNDALQAGDFAAGYLANLQYVAAWSAWVVQTQTTLHTEIDQINDGPVPAICRHPNPRLDHWSAGATFATPTTEAETANGWFVEYDGTIGTFTVSQQTFVLGQTVVPGNPKYHLRWAHTAAGSGSTKRILKVKIPGVHWRAGETVIRRLWLKGASAHNITATIRQNFGTGGSPSAEVTAATEVLVGTTSWTAYDIEATLPSLTGKTVGSAGDDCLVLALELPVNVTMTLDFAMDDFRQGDVAGQPLSDQFPLPLFHGGLGRAFGVPAADKLMFFDQSSGYLEYLALPGTGFGITGTAFVLLDDLLGLESLTGTGIPARIADNSWALRQVAVPTGMGVTNPAGVAGDITLTFGTALTNYVADPLSAAELASVTGTFGTAAFANIGTSGDAVGKLNAANTWSARQNFNAAVPFATSQDANGYAGYFGRYSSGYGGSAFNFVDTSGGSNHPTFVEFQFNGAGNFKVTNAGVGTLAGSTIVTAANVATYALPIGGGTLTAGLTVSSGTPFYDLYESDAAANSKWWRWVAAGGSCAFGILSDAAVPMDYLTFARSGATPTSITIGSGVTLQNSSSVAYIASVNSLTTDSTPDLFADYAPTYDASASANKKVLLGVARGANWDIILEDQKTSGTAGGTTTSGSFQTRTLNTEVYDARNECSLASNQFTLTAGTYEIEADVPCGGGDAFLAQLYNATGAVEILTGSSGNMGVPTATYGTSYSFIRGRFTIAAGQALEIRMRVAVTHATNGNGYPTSYGTERYTGVRLKRIA